MPFNAIQGKKYKEGIFANINFISRGVEIYQFDGLGLAEYRNNKVSNINMHLRYVDILKDSSFSIKSSAGKKIHIGL